MAPPQLSAQRRLPHVYGWALASELYAEASRLAHLTGLLQGQPSRRAVWAVHRLGPGRPHPWGCHAPGPGLIPGSVPGPGESEAALGPAGQPGVSLRPPYTSATVRKLWPALQGAAPHSLMYPLGKRSQRQSGAVQGTDGETRLPGSNPLPCPRSAARLLDHTSPPVPQFPHLGNRGYSNAYLRPGWRG